MTYPYRTAFDPLEYLRQYYTRAALAADDADLMRTLTGWLRGRGRRFAEAIDFGCGPTLHNSFALAPFADALDLADYLPANLAEARRWLDGEPDAHDWAPLFRGVLGCDPVGGDVPARTALYRSRVRNLLPCDLRAAHPLGRPAGYDLVASFFCAECVAADLGEWRTLFGRLLGLVRPGGSAFFAACGGATGYRIFGRWLPVVPLTAADLAGAFGAAGFDPASVAVHTFPALDWADDGFDHILVAYGDRP